MDRKAMAVHPIGQKTAGTKHAPKDIDKLLTVIRNSYILVHSRVLEVDSLGPFFFEPRAESSIGKVICPKCHGNSVISLDDPRNPNQFVRTCRKCGHTARLSKEITV